MILENYHAQIYTNRSIAVLPFMKKEINTILGLLSDDVEWGEPENPFNPAGKVYESDFVHLIRINDIGK
jgi:hypothetical protein